MEMKSGNRPVKDPRTEALRNIENKSNVSSIQHQNSRII
jgi:hypothetical protein